jgi:hypothetical protein
MEGGIADNPAPKRLPRKAKPKQKVIPQKAPNRFPRKVTSGVKKTSGRAQVKGKGNTMWLGQALKTYPSK